MIGDDIMLQGFMSLLTGVFTNQEQFEEATKQGLELPFAKHVNTICNDKIKNLPLNFQGFFMIEESYYTQHDHTNASSHIFLFTQENDTVILTSYDIPTPYTKQNFTYEIIDSIDYRCLKVSEKFTPAVYRYENGVWEGGSVSMFTPVLKFTLFERFSKEQLEVSETMEVNGKRTFGFDVPIIYKRVDEIRK